MKVRVLIIGFVLICYACNQIKDSNNIKNVVPDSVFRAFINNIKTDSIFYELNRSSQVLDYDFFCEFPDTLYLVKLHKYFKSRDILYILKQKEFAKSFKFDSTFFKDKIIISQDSILFYSHKPKEYGSYWRWISKKYGKPNFCVLGFPFFNKDHDIALIQISHHTSGFSGSGRTLLLKRLKNRWIIQEVIRKIQI